MRVQVLVEIKYDDVLTGFYLCNFGVPRDLTAQFAAMRKKLFNFILFLNNTSCPRTELRFGYFLGALSYFLYVLVSKRSDQCNVSIASLFSFIVTTVSHKIIPLQFSITFHSLVGKTCLD